MGGGRFTDNISYNHSSASRMANLMAQSGLSSGAIGIGGNSLSQSCPLLNFETPLNSVNPSVLQAIAVGDELVISVCDGSVLAITASGDVAGSITAIELAQLSACMEAGYKYAGIIEKKVGGTCMIRIQHKA